MNKRAVEQTGLIPRSIIRTFERFLKQLLPGAEMLVIQEFRISRYQVIVSVRCFLTLLLVPLLVNIFSKTFLITPLVEFIWNQQSTEIFLNSYQQKRALQEFYSFEDKMYFESFLTIKADEKKNQKNPSLFLTKEDALLLQSNEIQSKENYQLFQTRDYSKVLQTRENPLVLGSTEKPKQKDEPITSTLEQVSIHNNDSTSLLIKSREFGQMYQKKLLEIATNFNKESIEAISNVFADFFSFFSFTVAFVLMKPQIIILKSFLAESLYSLSDTTKSFLLILGTDLLVGFHSPHGWEVFLESFLRHLGLPENVEFMSLFVATFPVFLDTVFKYWIFRSLNKISPSTVATYHNMIE